MPSRNVDRCAQGRELILRGGRDDEPPEKSSRFKVRSGTWGNGMMRRSEVPDV
ncbi:MAG: hypothetical protein LKJ93_03675 [Bacteroidales bacterium]|nr:hypothetical protein [Bacteroidales bacterium]